MLNLNLWSLQYHRSECRDRIAPVCFWLCSADCYRKFLYYFLSKCFRRPKLDKFMGPEIVKAGELLKIRVLDHLILTSEGYMSLADEGLI
jgi:hypothetical protein